MKKISQFLSIDNNFVLFVFVQNVFSKPKGNSLRVPQSYNKVVVSPPSGPAVSATGGGTACAVLPSSASDSTSASFQPPTGQTQQSALTKRALIKLKCQHCNYLFATKPELLFYKVKRGHKRY